MSGGHVTTTKHYSAEMVFHVALYTPHHRVCFTFIFYSSHYTHVQGVLVYHLIPVYIKMYIIILQLSELPGKAQEFSMKGAIRLGKTLRLPQMAHFHNRHEV